jgi:branched-chain amino acid transport system permease protein
MVSMLSQSGMMVIFALSFNMLMGQAGPSFCHRTVRARRLFHRIFLDAAGAANCRCRWVMPLLAGLSGLGFGIVFTWRASSSPPSP